MALSKFDSKLLEFIYQLTLHQKLMNPREMSHIISIQGKKISERTIKRWLKYLRKEYFTYYPNINYEQLGLKRMILFLNEPKNPELTKIIPYKSYIMSGKNLTENCESLVIHYLVPYEKTKEFKQFWKYALKNKLVGSFICFEVKEGSKTTTLYSPIHKIITSDGYLNFCKDFDNSYFTRLFSENLKYKGKLKLNEKIIKNPLIVPILIEYFREHISSKKVWYNLKEKFGDNIWSYIKDIKVRNKKLDGVGISFVYKTIRQLHNTFDDFFSQIRIQYGPLYSNKNINLYVMLRLDPGKIIEFIDKISKYSLYTVVYQSQDSNVFLLDIVTNATGKSKINAEILPKFAEKNREILLDYDKSSFHWDSSKWLKVNYHNLFCPKTLSWKYDSKAYLKKLDELK